MFFLFLLHPCSINRNIVECKATFIAIVIWIFFSINRNIVECKASLNPDVSCSIIVLIETLWNVKETDE